MDQFPNLSPEEFKEHLLKNFFGWTSKRPRTKMEWWLSMEEYASYMYEEHHRAQKKAEEKTA